MLGVTPSLLTGQMQKARTKEPWGGSAATARATLKATALSRPRMPHAGGSRQEICWELTESLNLS